MAVLVRRNEAFCFFGASTGLSAVNVLIFPESAGPMRSVFSHHCLADISGTLAHRFSVQRIDENQLPVLLIAFDQRVIVTRAGFV
jgi:hypothetical protein